LKTRSRKRVRVVLPYKGEYLLERLLNPDWPSSMGKKRHVGGGVERDERVEEAAAREMHEELGVIVDPSDFVYLGEYENQHYLELLDHDLMPGKYKASRGSDPYITLEKTLPEGDDYIGPDLKIFYS
jgi:hypothetical protein